MTAATNSPLMPVASMSDAAASRAAAVRAQRVARAVQGNAPSDAIVAPIDPVVVPAADPGAPLHYEYGAKFEPPVGRVIHGMGQWEDGNVAYMAMLKGQGIDPASMLIYMHLGDWAGRAWESGLPHLAAKLIANRDAGRMVKLDVLPIGLDPTTRKEVAIDKEIADGVPRYDDRIRELAHTVRDVGGPVFIAFGEEFSGEWTGFTPYNYPKAFRHVVEIFRKEGADNAAFLWTYEPSASDDFDACDSKGCRWYPGDDVVDWFGIDVFDVKEFSGSTGHNGNDSPFGRTQRFLEMAKKHHRPVIIGECSATRVDITANPEDGMADWETWFVPFLRFVDDHPQIKAFYYETVDWSKIAQWAKMGWMDARINVNPYIAQQWMAELHKPKYLNAGDISLLNGYAASLKLDEPTHLKEAPPAPPGRGAAPPGPGGR